MRLSSRTIRRPGTIVPLLAMTIVAVFALVALAVDIGLMALARTHCQNAADAGAMSGVRILNGDASTDNNYAQVAPNAQNVATANKIINAPITTSMVTTEIGYYSYDATTQKFVPNFSGTKPDSESWSAVRINVAATQPMFFAKVLGINSLPAEATATAVHGPHNVSIVLDFSDSMRYSSQVSYPNYTTITGSLNPDPTFPKFGHWSTASFQSAMQRTTDYVDGGGEAHAISNFTKDSDGGPAIVKDFLFRDPGNGNALTNAFHRPTSPYNAMTWACPAPADWTTQDDTTATYVGDKWPRYNKASTGNYAVTVWNYVNNTNPTYSADHDRNNALTGPGGGAFDPATPSTPGNTEGYGSTFRGYVMGPGYYGKTFFYWPPDPRFHPSAATATPSTSDVAKDSSDRWMADWRKRFFYNGGSTNPLDGDNSRLWSTTTGQWRQASSTTYAVNYAAILAWIKSGPQVLPPNLRAGRVLYYSAIPSTIPTSGLTQDQLFWKAYIDYVVANAADATQAQYGYGRHPDSDSSFGTMRITARSSINGADNVSGNSDDPYMNYSDNPVRPRLQFWFGPLTMMHFIADTTTRTWSRNWMPGTAHESHCWQLKAGINSALDDIKKNHPNDWVGLVYFSGLQTYTSERVALGRDYMRMKNALFFPLNTLDHLSDTTYEVRPYDSSFTDTAAGNLPNANGFTSPECGFKVAYNQLSSRSGSYGRRGATKMVIFETDGVPNTPCDGTFTPGSPAPYNSYYASISVAGYVGNGDSTVLTRAKAAASQICALDTAANPGYSTTKAPARIHAIAFGDIFETTSTTKTMALQFLVDVEKIGSTSPSSATTLPSYKIIIGNYSTRIENLRQAFERIMQSGVQVTLIK